MTTENTFNFEKRRFVISLKSQFGFGSFYNSSSIQNNVKTKTRSSLVLARVLTELTGGLAGLIQNISLFLFKWLQDLSMIFLHFVSVFVRTWRSAKDCSNPHQCLLRCPSQHWHLSEAESHFIMWAAKRRASWPFSSMVVEIKKPLILSEVTLCNLWQMDVH